MTRKALLPGIVDRRRRGERPPASPYSRISPSASPFSSSSASPPAPRSVAEIRSSSIYFADLARALPSLCAAGSSVIDETGVPLCTATEIVPTSRGYKMMAAELEHAFDELFGLDGSTQSFPRRQSAAVRDWRNQIEGGLRVVASYQSG